MVRDQLLDDEIFGQLLFQTKKQMNMFSWFSDPLIIFSAYEDLGLLVSKYAIELNRYSEWILRNCGTTNLDKAPGD